MSRQIQIRRGSAMEHENFTGAVGEITMDTTNKTIHVHDGETPGGVALAKQSALDAADYVIDAWRSDDGKQWYRKYKSGWVEQGGFFSQTGTWRNGSCPTNDICLPVQMQSNQYSVTCARGESAGHILTSICNNLTVSSFKISSYCLADATEVSGWWRVEGMAS